MTIKSKLLKNLYLASALLIASFSVSTAFFSPQVYAGSPQLQAILDGIISGCKDMNKGSETWNSCVQKEDTLAKWAGCASGSNGAGLFAETAGKWNPIKSRTDACQVKINDSAAVAAKFQSSLNNIKNNCVNTEKTSGAVGQTTEWEKCEAWQGDLTTIGCSGTMFEKVSGGGAFGNDRMSYKQTTFDECQGIVSKIKTSPATEAGSGIAPGSDAAADPDCTTTLTSILSWIACPIIDMGSAFTDFVFKDFVRPMLENVPIDTKPTDKGYQAWQGFRLLGNLLLVGTLLAIVYGQTKGGGGR